MSQCKNHSNLFTDADASCPESSNRTCEPSEESASKTDENVNAKNLKELDRNQSDITESKVDRSKNITDSETSSENDAPKLKAVKVWSHTMKVRMYYISTVHAFTTNEEIQRKFLAVVTDVSDLGRTNLFPWCVDLCHILHFKLVLKGIIIVQLHRCGAQDQNLKSCYACEMKYLNILLHILAEHMNTQDQEEDEFIKMLQDKRNEG